MSISCKQATDYISKKEEGKLSIAQRYQLWRHFAECYLCKIFDNQNNQIRANILQHKHEDAAEELPQQNKEAILAALTKTED